MPNIENTNAISNVAVTRDWALVNEVKLRGHRVKVTLSNVSV